MFGSNENLIFIMIGAHDPIITLVNDSSGSPVNLWSFYLWDNYSKIHVFSSLKTSVSPGNDMIGFAYGNLRYGKFNVSNIPPYGYSSIEIRYDSSYIGYSELRGVYI